MRPVFSRYALVVFLLLVASCIPAARISAQESPTPAPSETPFATPLPSESPSPEATPTQTPTTAPSGSPPATPAPLPLVANPASVQSNIGAARDVNIQGASGTLSATLDPKIAAVTINGSTVTVSPIVNGRATLHVVDAAGASVDIPLRVAPNAGTIARQLALKVTGEPVDPNFIATQAALAVRQATSANPGTTVTIGQVAPPASPLGIGGQLALSVPVSILGGDQYLDVNDATQINVQNVAAAPFEPMVLYYSDDPERILSDGILFRGSVSQQPVRIYDYHENGSDPRRLVVALSTSSTAASSVHVIEAFAGPNIDVMSVGHAVTKNFLISKPRNQGVIVDLPDGAPFLARDVLLGFRQGVADVADFRVLSGGPVTITVLAVSPNVAPATLLDGPVLPGDGKGRHGTFSLSNYGAQTLEYTAGGDDASVTLGDREPTVPTADPKDPGADFGDYGVMFDLALNVHNPTDAAQTVYLYEAPRGGPVRASYLVDGAATPTELGCATSPPNATSPPHRYLIAQFELTPRSSQAHIVRTMTDGGSNYPIEVGLTAQVPQPATPAISAPDGCFPKPQPSAAPEPAPGLP